MSKVDWSLAPEGCTHKDFSVCGLWYKFDIEKNTVSFWNSDRGGYWSLSGTPAQYEDGSMEDMEPKPWSGPEDGLPPVGQECEVEVDGGAYEYCTVLAHGFDDFKPHAVVQCASGLWKEEVTGFRAIKTQEQIDRDKRETAIRELMDIAQVDCRVTAARLVDAGFKREVV